MRTAIFGGSFDPPHIGHMKMAEKSRNQFGLERLILLPTGLPPHKNGKLSSDPVHRYEMCRIEADKYGFELSDYEIFSNKYCYSADTLEHFAEKFSGDELFFIIGGDSINYIDKWYMPERIFAVCSIIVGAREKINMELVDRMRKIYDAKIYFTENEIIDISSTKIRENIKAGIPVTGMVSKETEEYINKNLLYR